MNPILSSINEDIVNYQQFFGRKPTAILMGSVPETELKRLALMEFGLVEDPTGGHGGSFKVGRNNRVFDVPIIPVGDSSTGWVLI